MSPPDDLTWLALTVYLEAEGESYEGKLAVAHCIVNRSRLRKKSIADTVFSAWQFSAWNTDSPRRLALDSIHKIAWDDCVKVSLAAMHGAEADPTGGATHYLNTVATRAARKYGDLPEWARDPKSPTEVDPTKLTKVIGKHTFLIA